MNNDWPRWIKSSVAKYFSRHVPVLVEGQFRPSAQAIDRYELRFDGLDISEKVQGEFRIGFVVNLLITTVSNEADIYKIDRMKGRGADPFVTRIPIYKYGDDGAAVGCITRKSNISVQDFGYISDNVFTTSVNAYYVFEPYEIYSRYEATLELDLETNLEASD